MKITEEHYLAATGQTPSLFDLLRANCPKGGQSGHYFCGWNHEQNLPMTMAGPKTKDPTP